ncbi:Rap guanine nucleotide exchange factor 5 [Chelonia mydas]|uniref:Rap guanine nucleotide exchange factor 5 n=1 Tax=Chelonia mydas TaxID=8469 RepID=M7BNW0_CHEMY|nr:Rap guanine nucleotide exchange factor 5 [Chelonia mydas]
MCWIVIRDCYNMKYVAECGKSCVGSELVDWLLEHCPFVKCRSTAVGVWQLLLDMGIVLSGQCYGNKSYHVDRQLYFQDTHVFYQFSADECTYLFCEFERDEGWQNGVKLLLQLVPLTSPRAAICNLPGQKIEDTAETNAEILARLTSAVQKELAAVIALKARKSAVYQNEENSNQEAKGPEDFKYASDAQAGVLCKLQERDDIGRIELVQKLARENCQFLQVDRKEPEKTEQMSVNGNFSRHTEINGKKVSSGDSWHECGHTPTVCLQGSDAIPRQAWSPLSSLSLYVSWVLADAVLHCYTAAATHCLVAANGAIGLIAIVVMSEVLRAASVRELPLPTFDVPYFKYIDEEDEEDEWSSRSQSSIEYDSVDCLLSDRYVVVSGTPEKILEHLLNDLHLEAVQDKETGGAPTTTPHLYVDSYKGASCNRDEDFGDEEDDSAHQANGETVLPNSQELFITQEPIPFQPGLPDLEGGEGTSGNMATVEGMLSGAPSAMASPRILVGRRVHGSEQLPAALIWTQIQLGGPSPAMNDQGKEENADVPCRKRKVLHLVSQWTSLYKDWLHEDEHLKQFLKNKAFFHQFSLKENWHQHKGTMNETEEIFCRVYITEHSYVSVKTKVSTSAQEILKIIAEKIQHAEEDLTLVTVTFSGEKHELQPNDPAISKSLEATSRMFVYRKDLTETLQELIYFTFSRQGSGENTVNLSLLLQRCNEVQLWVATEILLCSQLCKRVQLVKKFIKIAAHCKAQRNLNSFFAIVMGLNTASVSRLSQTWEKIPGKFKKLFTELESLTDPSLNHKAYRDTFKKMKSPKIPFMPLLLKDVTFIHEGNKTFLDNLVNFEKLHMIADTVRSLRHCRNNQCGNEVPPKENQELKPHVYHLHVIDDQQTLFELSHRIEPRV